MALAPLGTMAFAPRPVLADDPTHACVGAAHDGQQLRDHGSLVAARDEFVRCSSSTCPDIVRESCQRWRAELEARLPTVVFGARAPDGTDLTAARVLVDGKVVTEGLDGRSFALDPGRHQVVFEATGRSPVRQVILVREGEKVRSIAVVLAPPGAPAAPPAPRHPNYTPAFVSGAVSLLGVGAFAVFGATGESEKSHLSKTCAPSETCSPGDVSSARSKLIVADLALGVGVAAGVVTGVLWWRASDRSSVAVSPSAGGGAAIFAHAF